jgi:hypothetical protein
MRRSITATRDSSKARELLGWTPSFPELDQQIAHDWTWFRDEMQAVRSPTAARWCCRSWRLSSSKRVSLRLTANGFFRATVALATLPGLEC